MKKLKFSLLALSVVASGALTITAAPAPTPGYVYPLTVAFTNPAPLLVCIQALPASTTNSALLVGDNGVIATEGSGKLDGVTDVTMDLGGGTNGHFVAGISGTLGSVAKKNAPLLTTANMSIKGKGFADGGGFQVPGTMTLTFKGQSDITTNGQSGIVTTAPGWNIIRNADGTTNEMVRFDPFFNTYGLLQNYVTYGFAVHEYSMDTSTTTNGSGTNVSLLVTNLVNETIANHHLRGDYTITNSPFDYSGTHRIHFGTPIFPADYYSTQFNNSLPAGYITVPGYGSNIVINAWAIAGESVFTTNRTVTTVTNAAMLVVYATNESISVGSTSNANNTIPGNTVVLDSTNNVFNVFLTNTTAAGTNTYLVLTPVSTNGAASTNVYYTGSSAIQTSAHFGEEFLNSIINEGFDTNGILSSTASNYFTLNQSLLFSTSVTTNGSGTNTQDVWTNAWVTYSFGFTNIDGASRPPLSFFISNAVGGSSVSLYSNYVATTSRVVSTNFVTITVTNTPIFGASFTDLAVAEAAYSSSIAYSNIASRAGTFFDSYTGPLNGQLGFMWAVQGEDYFDQGIVTGFTPTTNDVLFSVTQLATRTNVNTWKEIVGTLNGSVNAGKLKKTFKNAPAIFEEAHNIYTPVPGATDASYYVDFVANDNLSVYTNDSFSAEVKQIGKTLWTSGSDWDAFNGAGTIATSKTKGTTYKATLNGVAREAGSKLTLAGTNGPIAADYSVTSNAPPVMVTVTNLASPVGSYLSITNTTSGVLVVPTVSQTNMVISGNTTTFYVYNYPLFYVTNSFFQSTIVSNGISSVALSGKIKGQTLPPNLLGVNQGAIVPNPWDYQTFIFATNAPVVQTITTNYVGWTPGSANWTNQPPRY
jgi:hypothetical protein